MREFYRYRIGWTACVFGLVVLSFVGWAAFALAGSESTPTVTAPISTGALTPFTPGGFSPAAPQIIDELRKVTTGVDKRLTFSIAPQNETAIAGDPNNPNIIVGGMNDYSILTSGFGGNGVVYSHDGGVTWTHHPTGVVLPAGYNSRGGDPSIEFDTQGRVFYGSLAIAGTGSPFQANNGLWVSRSTDGGVTWSPMVAVANNVYPGSGTVNFEDKPYLTVDQNPMSPYKDRIYISWTRYYAGAHPAGGTGGGDIMVGRSSDGGLTWTSLRLPVPSNVGTGTVGAAYVQGSEPEVAANGDLYVTFWFGGRIEVWKSTNGGVSFTQMTQPFGVGFSNISTPSPLPNESFRVNSFPNIETNPCKPNYVYVVVADDPDNVTGGGTDDADIFFARSTDGGVTWGPKTRVNNDALVRNQTFPWMSVSKRGAIQVIWYDTRNDAANHLLDVYGAQSLDEGATFCSNYRVTDASFEPNTGQFSGNSFFGDYNGLGTTAGNIFHALWTDTRAGVSTEQEIYYDKITCDVAQLMCPPDGVLPSDGPPQYVLNGFKITNVSGCALAFNYSLQTAGPGVLNNCGNPLSLAGTTPVLNPGQSFMPPNACVDFPLHNPYLAQNICYLVSPVNNTCWQDTCCTSITLDPALPVAFQAFDVRARGGNIELRWSVLDAFDVAGYNVYRSDNGVDFVKLNSNGLLASTSLYYIDSGVEVGKQYTYKIGAMEPSGEIMSIPRQANLELLAATLDQNRPNPFNPVTTITFNLPSDETARLSVYDVEGKLVKRLFEGKASRGANHVDWDGTNANGEKVSSGVYYYRLIAGKFEQTRKMVLLK